MACPFCKHELLDIVCVSKHKPPPEEFEGFDDEYEWRYLKDIDVELWQIENPERSYPKNKGIRKYVMFSSYSDFLNKYEQELNEHCFSASPPKEDKEKQCELN